MTFYVDAPKRMFLDTEDGFIYAETRNNVIALSSVSSHYLPDLFVRDSLYDYSNWKIDESMFDPLEITTE